MEVRISVLTDPVPAARPRFNGRHAYQPQRNRDYREVVRAAAVAAMNGRAVMEGAVDVTIKLFRRFKQTSRRFGDTDNFAKSILDGLSSIVFRDDAQVIKLTVEKYTSKTDPRAEIVVSDSGGDVR